MGEWYHRMRVVSSKMSIFVSFGRYISRTFIAKAKNKINRLPLGICTAVPRRLFADTEIYDLESP